jgi:N-methylhydantoinase B
MKSNAESGLDPILLTLVQNRLNYISQRMGLTMMRSARSPLLSQAHDFSCFVTDGHGRIMSQADGIPIHTGGGGIAVRTILESFGRDINAGDVFVLNDPYVAGGSHLPDILIARPVFVDNILFGFCCNRAHQSDIGGGAPGSFYASATEIFQEGLRIPPLRLAERNEIKRDVWRLLMLNSRTPRLMDGDLRAMLGSTRIGANHVEELIGELGARVCEDYFAGILDLGEQRMRAEIERLPDGSYQGEDRTDNDCFEQGDHYIRVTLTIKGSDLTVDFAGTDSQIKGFKNSGLANTMSAVYVALSAFLSPDLPGNEGVFRAVKIVAPQGTIVNPIPPAPTTMSTLCVASEIIHAVWQALNKADPERSCAGWGKMIYPITSGRQRDDTIYVMYHWSAGVGVGAVKGRDGFNCNGAIINLCGIKLPNVEGYEQNYPVHFLKVEFRTDAGGPGMYRGGTGIDYVVDLEQYSVLTVRGEGLWTPSGFGTAGGMDGAAGQMSLDPLEGERLRKYEVRNIGPTRLSIQSAGGGGWGNPFSRDADRVLRDIRDEVVSKEAARQIYGVVADETGRSIDAQKTNALRQQMTATLQRVV